MHDPETDATRYLGDDLDLAQRERFSHHLLTCSDCWSEVEQAHHGRALLEAQRTVVPVDLRDRMRGLVASEQAPAHPSRAVHLWRQRLVLPAAAGVAAVLLVGLVREPSDPAALREAVQDYAIQQLPGAGLPAAAAPDLSALRLQPVGAGGGTYAGLDVDGYAYRDPAGRRIVLYLSDQPFPEAPDAERLAGKDGPWIADRGDVLVLYARVPHSLLVVGEDPTLVRSAASALGVL